MIDKIKITLINFILNTKKIFDKYVLWIAFIISLITYSFWGYIKEATGFRIFYLGVALFILLLSYKIRLDDKKSFIKFLIYELAVANLIKELFLEPGKLKLGEALLIVIIPFIWYLKNDKYNRILERDNDNSKWNSIFYYWEKIRKIFRKKTTK